MVFGCACGESVVALGVILWVFAVFGMCYESNLCGGGESKAAPTGLVEKND